MRENAFYAITKVCCIIIYYCVSFVKVLRRPLKRSYTLMMLSHNSLGMKVMQMINNTSITGLNIPILQSKHAMNIIKKIPPPRSMSIFITLGREAEGKK